MKIVMYIIFRQIDALQQRIKDEIDVADKLRQEITALQKMSEVEKKNLTNVSKIISMFVSLKYDRFSLIRSP